LRYLGRIARGRKQGDLLLGAKERGVRHLSSSFTCFLGVRGGGGGLFGLFWMMGRERRERERRGEPSILNPFAKRG